MLTLLAPPKTLVGLVEECGVVGCEQSCQPGAGRMRRCWSGPLHVFRDGVWGWSLLGIPTGIQGEFADSAAATLEGR